jgi:beta-galactosidase
MKTLQFGVAYYDEYMPAPRVEEDVAMMLRAGITVVRIGESTWSTLEPHDGVFDFTSLDRVLAAMGKAGIDVIVGTPTYAVPTWLVRKHPEVLATTAAGRNRYGPRQNMDITHPSFRLHAERVIRAIIGHTAGHPAVIGFQADNETKHYNNFGPSVQAGFVAHLKARFGTVEALNSAFGLDYWSNRINAWEDFPPVEASINASLSAAYAAYQRSLVTEYLAWQVGLINEYKRPGQFVTHNFDFEWRGHSFGVQPDVDHFEASRPFDVAGIDVYHPTQEHLTGAEIAFCGDLARGLKQDNYLLLETEAQGYPEWMPFPGQLRLQAFSHFASGANLVEYWHWHSIHNSFETYWKGLLSHDLASNPTYEEAVVWGNEVKRLGPRLVNLKKHNRAAFVVSNQSLSAIKAFQMYFRELTYNDVVRRMYDAAYRLGIECDIISVEQDDLSAYELLFVPALYSAPDAALLRYNAFAARGGTLIASLLSGFSDENVKVRTQTQPGLLSRSLGVAYSQFTRAEALPLRGDPFGVGTEHNRVDGWFELVDPGTAETLAAYDHPHWGRYAAVTVNRHEAGWGAYIGCQPDPAVMEASLRAILGRTGQAQRLMHATWPVVRKTGTNARGRRVAYYLNYADRTSSVKYVGQAGRELLGDHPVSPGDALSLAPWGLQIVEEDSPS